MFLNGLFFFFFNQKLFFLGQVNSYNFCTATLLLFVSLTFFFFVPWLKPTFNFLLISNIGQWGAFSSVGLFSFYSLSFISFIYLVWLVDFFFKKNIVKKSRNQATPTVTTIIVNGFFKCLKDRFLILFSIPYRCFSS